MTRRWSSRISAGNSSTTLLPGSGAPPTFRSASTATALGASELTLAKPAGVLDGDVLTALIAQHGTSIPTAPLGWNFIRRDTTISPTYQQSLYWRRVSPDFPVSPAFRAANSGAAAQATSVTITKPAGVVLDDVMVAQIAQGKDAAPTFVAASTVAICAGNNTIVAKPAGTVQNDVMIAQISFTNDGDVNLPAGWNLIRDDRSGTPPQNIGPRQKLLWKRAGASEPTSYNFTAIGLSGRAITLVTYRGVVLIGDPVDAHGGQLGTTAAVAPSITTTGFHRMLIACFSSNQDMIIEGPKWTPPAGMTERSDNGINCNLADISSEFADQVVQQGATGTRTATQVGASIRTVGALVALKPEPQALQTVTPPAGWTTIRIDDTDYRSSLYWLRAGAAEPADYTWIFGGAVDAAGIIAAYDGVIPAVDPIDAHNGAITQGANHTNVTAPSVTTTVANTMLVGLFSGRSIDGATATWTAPTGMTQRREQSDGTATIPISAEEADQFLSAIGATGSRTATASQTLDNSVGNLVALKPDTTGSPIFIGIPEAILDYSDIRLFVESSHTSAANGLQVEWSSDGVNFRVMDAWTMRDEFIDTVAGFARSEPIPVRARFMRVVYRNGATAQTFFRLQTILVPEADQPLSRIPEHYVMRTGQASVPINVFRDVTSLSQLSQDKAVEVLGYGAVPENTPVIGNAFDYVMRLIIGGATVHSAIVRNDIGSWVAPLRLETEGQTIKVQVLHNQAIAQTFNGAIQVREL